MNNFDEHYFRTINYTNYLDREERYVKLANELCDYLEKLGCITPTSKFIDYGDRKSTRLNSSHRT